MLGLSHLRHLLSGGKKGKELAWEGKKNTNGPICTFTVTSFEQVVLGL